LLDSGKCVIAYKGRTTNFRSSENKFKVLSRVAFATKVCDACFRRALDDENLKFTPTTNFRSRRSFHEFQANSEFLDGSVELHIYWWTDPSLWSDSPNQLKIHRKHALSFSRKLFDSPYNGILFRFVFGTSEGVLNFEFRPVLWDGYFNDIMCGEELFGEVGDHFEVD
jgi:hypothetical protein